MSSEEQRAEEYRESMIEMARLFLRRLEELQGDPAAYNALMSRLFPLMRDEGWESPYRDEIEESETLA